VGQNKSLQAREDDDIIQTLILCCLKKAEATKTADFRSLFIINRKYEL